MRVLLVGSGGREHALAWKLCQSDQVEELFVLPGNGGTARLARSQNVNLDPGALDCVVTFAQERKVDLTIVGPEAPLVQGMVDRFQSDGLRIFGPSAAAARIEGSKAFSKAFMMRHGIPTGHAEVFEDFDEATRYLRSLDGVPVIKASGLAAGKGVILPDTKAGAAQVLQSMLLERRFGEASATVLIEERLEGPEITVLAFSDGRTVRVMPPAQDHKRLLDNDYGPNTGGMGAFAPSPLATTEMVAQVEREILQPTIDGMAAEGTPYVGVLYAGLMVTQDGPKVIEFNCRFGDPEAQVVLPLMESDLVELCLACIEGELDKVEPHWRDDAAVGVVMASPGYPDDYTTGVEIQGMEDAEALGCLVFHAGTVYKDDRLLTAGGRVLAVTALGPDLHRARMTAYAGVQKIEFNNAYYRRDIARIQ